MPNQKKKKNAEENIKIDAHYDNKIPTFDTTLARASTQTTTTLSYSNPHHTAKPTTSTGENDTQTEKAGKGDPRHMNKTDTS